MSIIYYVNEPIYSINNIKCYFTIFISYEKRFSMLPKLLRYKAYCEDTEQSSTLIRELIIKMLGLYNKKFSYTDCEIAKYINKINQKYLNSIKILSNIVDSKLSLST